MGFEYTSIVIVIVIAQNSFQMFDISRDYRIRALELYIISY